MIKSILNRTFPYVPSVRTDIRVTFRREERRLKELREADARAAAETKQKVATLKRKSGDSK